MKLLLAHCRTFFQKMTSLKPLLLNDNGFEWSIVPMLDGLIALLLR